MACRLGKGLVVLWLLHFPLLAAANKPFDANHTLWTEVLKRYQTAEGNVDYKQLKTDAADKQHAFPRYLANLSHVKKDEFQSWNRESQMAFLINAYNALTWKLVVDHYPLKAIKDLGTIFKSPWQREFFSLFDGSVKMLDSLQHEFLRTQFKDSRVHAAINLAALSSPRLLPTAFIGAKLNAQLDGAFRDFLSDAKRNRYDATSGTLYLSKIFDWYERDFNGPSGIRKTIETYGPVAAKEALKAGGKVRYELYRWELNDSVRFDAAAKESSQLQDHREL